MFQPCDLQQYERLTGIARRVRDMIHKRAIQEYCAAFGSKADRYSRLDMCVIHNSLISLEQGNPWREVDYKHMRKAAWLCEKSHEPSRIVSAWYARKTKRN